MGVELILECGNYLGESPLWDPARGEVVWVNIHDGEIWRYDPIRQRLQEHRLPERVGAIGLRQSGGLVVALASGFALFDLDTEELERLGKVEEDLETTRLNDGRVDRRGRFVCGGMDEAENQSPISAVYRLDPDHSVHRIIDGIHCANSTCFSLDGTTMYFSDMPSRKIVAYEYDMGDGRPHSPRTFADLAGEPGSPDGSTIDGEGYLWNAQWGGGRVVRYAPDGTIDRIVHLPTTNPTSVCFGGANYQTLYITTARFGLAAATLAGEPVAGGLFALETDVRGLPEPQFAG